MQPVETSDWSEVYRANNDERSLRGIRARYRRLEEAFEGKYSCRPDFYARAPGRVNLIGEHVDYEGYAVLPMAISREVVLAVSIPTRSDPAGGFLELANLESRFPSSRVSSRPRPLAIGERDGASSHDWTDYFRCGYKGVWCLSRDVVAGRSSADRPPADGGLDDISQWMEGMEETGIPMKIMVDGDVPTGSGLSSSSALVVASAIATRRGIQLAMERKNAKPAPGYHHPWATSFSAEETGELCRVAERYIGTLSGGMDQAISCCGVAGKAQLIRFDPLRTELVALPTDAMFVIANSLTVSEKATTASTRYNLRVVECMLAAKVLAKALDISDWSAMETLKQVQDSLGLDTSDEMLPLVQRHLGHCDAWSVRQLEDRLDVAQLRDAFREPVSSVDEVLRAPNATFYLHRRARHVYSEAARVLEFRSAVAAEALGAIMDASHESCRGDYDCSSAELDALVECCRRQPGAFGSRLTGAGWGGCNVSLVAAHAVEAFVAAVEREFYGPRTGQVPSRHIFACRPANGASIYVPVYDV